MHEDRPMSDDAPPLYEDEHPYAAQVAPTAKIVRDVFAGRRGLIRERLLADLGSAETRAHFLECVASRLGGESGLTREEAESETRSLFLKFYELVAAEAGLNEFDAETYVGTFILSFDLTMIDYELG
jgi:hypothetical protein